MTELQLCLAEMTELLLCTSDITFKSRVVVCSKYRVPSRSVVHSIKFKDMQVALQLKMMYVMH